MQLRRPFLWSIIAAGIAALLVWVGATHAPAGAPSASPPTEPRAERAAVPPAAAERAAAPDPADPTPTGCAGRRSLALGLLGWPSDVVLPEPADEAECRGQLVVLAAVAEVRRLDRDGRPIPYPASTPPEYRREAVEAAVQEALAACPELDLELVGMDCDEFPCFAQVVGGGNLPDCPTWRTRYGTALSVASASMVSADGAPFSYQIVGPAPPPATSAAVDGERLMKRMDARSEALADKLVEERGARPYTDAERAEQLRAFDALARER